jgi:ribosomal protein L7/L12
MSSFKLQTVLSQLSDLTPAELSEVKAAVNEKLESHLRALGANDDLTEEEWKRLEDDSLLGCIKMVRDRTGLGLVDSKAYVGRARAKGRKLRALTPSGDSHDESDDNGAGPQRDSEGHTLYCPRECCDTGQDFGNGGRWEDHK